MFMTRLGASLVILALMITGCSPDSSRSEESGERGGAAGSPKVLSVPDSSGFSRPLGTEGILRADIVGDTACFWLENEKDDSENLRTFIIWPQNTTTNLTGSIIYDEARNIRAEVGSKISLGGAVLDEDVQDLEPMTKDCESISGDARWKVVTYWS